ncbi:MAG: hypothetical protein K0R51_1771 [Cytophagaceae bacterium]|jgi:hypothetical protein|nr:hypothetical protein [Cytophagaceae bacterium]
MGKKYIVYQAYGNEAILNEALYSMLSFYKIHGQDYRDISIVVYTDHPLHFESVLGKDKVQCKPLSADQVKEWRGTIDFVHRVKIETLIDFTSTMQEDLVLYLDSDIVFLKPVDALFDKIKQGVLVMHEFEGKLNDSTFPLIVKMGKFIKGHQKELNDRGLEVPVDTGVWNAGVIGFQSSRKDLLTKVLCFTDGFYTLYPKHIAEQFGFSLYLSKEGAVFTSSEYLFHYWSFKEFRGILHDFFQYHRAKGSDLVKLLQEIDYISPIKLGEPKRIYDKMHWLPKAFRKLKKNRWEMPAYKYWE